MTENEFGKIVSRIDFERLTDWEEKFLESCERRMKRYGDLLPWMEERLRVANRNDRKGGGNKLEKSKNDICCPICEKKLGEWKQVDGEVEIVLFCRSCKRTGNFKKKS